MPSIKYRAANFSSNQGAALSGRHSLAVSESDLVWAAITVGKPGATHLLAHRFHSLSDIVARMHSIYANLQCKAGHYYKSSLYASLDPTEKAAASYFLGMTGAKLLCGRLLDTPWLFHISMLGPLGMHYQLHSRSQPDLIGLNSSGEWVVAEAKGRSSGFSAAAMSEAKRQTQQIRHVNNKPPCLRVAVQASFSPDLSLDIEDPEEQEESAPDLTVNVKTVMRNYYAAVLEVTRDAKPINLSGKPFYLRTLEDFGLAVGLAKDVKLALEADTAYLSPTLVGNQRSNDSRNYAPWCPSSALA